MNDHLWWMQWAPWTVVQLLVPAVFIIAARRNRPYRPHAARWALCLAALQIAGSGLVVLVAWLVDTPQVPWGSPNMLSAPNTWAFIRRGWMMSALPATSTLITTYMILEQPDRPRAVRSEDSAS